MLLTENQITTIASNIELLDVINYINKHQEEYKNFVENEKSKGKKNTEPIPEYITQALNTGKFKVAI